MSILPEAIWAPSPNTTRGQPTVLSSDPKGERVAYAANKSIFLRSIDDPAISRQYTEHTQSTTVARFSPSGFYVASGDVSGTVRVWDCVGEGATKGEYSIISGRINDIAWDGDSQRIIAVGEGRERWGHCITADSGNSVGEIAGHSAKINSVAIRQQRPLRAATGSDDTTVAFFHGAPFKFNTSLREQHSRYVYSTEFSPDGSLLVSVGADKQIWLYDGKTGEVKTQIGDGAHTGSIFGVSWAQDSKQLVTASADQTVRIWDVEAGKATSTWRMGDEGVVSVQDQQVGVVWPRGRSDGLVISVDLAGNLNYFSPSSPKPTRVVYGQQRSISAADTAGDTDGKPTTFFTGGVDGRVRAWDIAKGEAKTIDGEGHTTVLSGIASSSDGKRVYTAGWDDKILSADVASTSFAGTGAIKPSGQPRSITTLASGLAFVSTSSGIDILKDCTKAGEHVLKFNVTNALAASTAKNLLAVGADDKTVHIFTVSSTSLSESHIISTDLKTPASTLAFSPDGTNLAVGTNGGGIVVFDTASWAVATNRWSAHTARVSSVAWRKDGKFVASGSLDTNVFVWSLAEPGKRIKAPNAHKDGVNVVRWADEGTVLSAGADAVVRVWKVTGI